MEEEQNPYQRMYEEIYVPRLLSAIEGLGEKLESAESQRESFETIQKLERLCTGLEDEKVILLNESGHIPVEIGDAQYTSISEALEDLRKRSKISQVKLAEYADVSQRTIYRLEKFGTSRVSQRTIRRILGVFDIQPPEKREEVYRLK